MIAKSLRSRLGYIGRMIHIHDRAPSLLRVLVGGRLVLGSVDDREPLHEPACISAAVKPRNEVLPLGNADVPSRTTAGGLLTIHS